jgi:small subunit ribosomal protein S20
MANHPSAAKRNRQRLVRTARNRNVRASVRTAVKKARAAIATGGADAKAIVDAAAIELARAASAGVVHVNAAARTTSRIMAALHKRTSASN